MKNIILILVFLLISCQADFSYIIKNPATLDAQKYMKYKSNLSLSTEASGTTFLQPSTGSIDLRSSKPGVVIYHFPLSHAISEGTLFVRAETFHWNYSRGYSLIFLSSNGSNWEKMVEASSPAFGKWNSGIFSGSLPPSFRGKKNIYIKVILYSYGSKASRGGAMTNTAQHLRYNPSRDNITFKLDVKSLIQNEKNKNNNSFNNVLNNLTSDEHLESLSFDNILNNQNNNENTAEEKKSLGDCYVGCKPSNTKYTSCAISCGKGKAPLVNQGMSSIITGPTSWDKCADSMQKLGIDGW